MNTSSSSQYWQWKQYDALGRMTYESHPSTAANLTQSEPGTSIFYNGLQTTISRRNQKQSGATETQTTTELRNAAGQLIQSQQDNGTQPLYTYFDYEPFGNLRWLKDPGGATSTFVYDASGRLSSMVDPDRGAWSYQYYPTGELKSQTDAKGQQARFEYDRLGRLTKREVKLSSTAAWQTEGTWAYDSASMGVGKPASVTGVGGYSRSYRYDGFSRLQQEKTTIDGKDYPIDYGYDGQSRVNLITYPMVGSTRYAVRNIYGAYGHLNEVQNAANATQVYWKARGRTADGMVNLEDLGYDTSKVTTTRGFDPATGRLTSIKTTRSSSDVQDLAYSYDRLGNLEERKDNIRLLTENFTYDPVNRLTTAKVGAATKTYGYDAGSNLTSKSDVGTYTYSSGTCGGGAHAVKKVGTLNYCYDANGNMTSGDSRSLSYNWFNLPTTITKGSNTYTFTYDPEHKRSKQNGPGLSVVYINPRYDQGPHFEVETRGSLTEYKHYISGAEGPVAMYVTRSNGSNQTFYVHKDHLGSVEVVTDQSGVATDVRSFDPWGKPRNSNWTDAASPLALYDTHHGYTGHEHLSEDLGLIHMNARLYDPRLGRFLQADPIGIDGGMNLYAYANNNPLTYVDLAGTFETYPIYMQGSYGGEIKYRPVFKSALRDDAKGTTDFLASQAGKGVKFGYKGVDKVISAAPSFLQGEPVGVDRGPWWDFFGWSDRSRAGKIEDESDPLLRAWFVNEFGEDGLIGGVIRTDYEKLLRKTREILEDKQYDYHYVYGDDAVRFERLRENVSVFTLRIPGASAKERMRMIDEWTR